MLNVRKKKKLRLVGFLMFLLLGWVVHCWLAAVSGIEIKNVGVSFGWSGWLVIILSLVLLLCLSWFGWRNDYLGISVVLIGGWINMFDRVYFGYVRDYWWLGPVYNNIADWIISIGVGIFIWEIWKKK